MILPDPAMHARQWRSFPNPSGVDPIQLAVAINVIYLGLVEQQVGSLCARSGPSEYWRRKMSVVGCAESLWSPAGRWQSAHR
jgi:hypothetical protein